MMVIMCNIDVQSNDPQVEPPESWCVSIDFGVCGRYTKYAMCLHYIVSVVQPPFLQEGYGLLK